MNKNPLFIEYYSHVNEPCYKINLPWTRYKKHTVVLCTVSEGIVFARKLARREIMKHLTEAMKEGLT